MNVGVVLDLDLDLDLVMNLVVDPGDLLHLQGQIGRAHV